MNTMTRALLGFYCVILMVCPLRAQEADSLAASAALDSLVTAWSQGDAAAITRLLPNRRVQITMQQHQPTAWVSPDQAYYLFLNHFSKIKNRRVATSSPSLPITQDQPLMAIVWQEYRRIGRGRIVRDEILVRFVFERSRWVLDSLVRKGEREAKP